jgi:hypothetical protein
MIFDWEILKSGNIIVHIYDQVSYHDDVDLSLVNKTKQTNKQAHPPMLQY